MYRPATPDLGLTRNGVPEQQTEPHPNVVHEDPAPMGRIHEILSACTRCGNRAILSRATHEEIVLTLQFCIVQHAISANDARRDGPQAARPFDEEVEVAILLECLKKLLRCVFLTTERFESITTLKDMIPALNEELVLLQSKNSSSPSTPPSEAAAKAE